MPPFTSPNPRILAPLPRRDILAVCAFLKPSRAARPIDACNDPESFLDRLAEAARMQ
jgi:hypothetical protein